MSTTEPNIINEGDEIVAAVSSPPSSPRPLKRVNKVAKSKSSVYNVFTRGRTKIYLDPDYNLTDVASAYDAETYFRMAVDRFTGEVWKNGWAIVGKDQNAVKYVRRRLKDIAMASGQPIEDVFEEITRQLVLFSNCFLELIRSEEGSSGRRWMRFDGKEMVPIAGLKVIDATSMKIARADNGDVLGYKQEIPGAVRWPEWGPDGIMHIHYAKSVGLAFGTPYIVPVLDDIRALRNIEQNVEILVFQHSVPLFHFTIGTEQAPAQPGEIEELREELEEMPQNGVIITPERHSVEAIGAQGEGVDASPYLKHFKDRVLSGVRLGAVAVGEGSTANRSTAGTINSIIQDVTKVFQMRIKLFIDQLILQILHEGGFSESPSDGTSPAELFIPEIDIEKKILKENHAVELWVQNAITSAEVRKELGKDPFTEEEWNDTYWMRIGQPKALIQSLDEQYVTTGANKGGATTSGGSTSKSTANKNNPRNQHGKRGAPKTSKDSIDVADMITEKVEDEHALLLSRLGYQSLHAGFMAIFNDLKHDIKARIGTEDPKKEQIMEGLVDLAMLSMHDLTVSYFHRAAQLGAASFGSISDPQGITTEMSEAVKTDLIRFSKDIGKRIKSSLTEDDPVADIDYSMDALAYRLDFISRYHILKAFNLGAVKGAISLGDNEIAVVTHTNDPEHQNRLLNLAEGIDLSDIPPYRANCTCVIKRKS